MAYEAKCQPDVYELIKSKWRWFMTVGVTTMTSCWSADRDEDSGFDHMVVICDLIKIRAKAWKKSKHDSRNWESAGSKERELFGQLLIKRKKETND